MNNMLALRKVRSFTIEGIAASILLKPALSVGPRTRMIRGCLLYSLG